MDSVWQVGIIALIAGIMIGGLAYRLFGRSSRESEKIQHELEANREELDQYKASVNEHFNKTSELVNDLTQNYVRVYQHLAEGAHNLGDSKTFNNLLQQHPGKVSLTVDGESQMPGPAAENTVFESTASEVAATEPARDFADPPIAEAAVESAAAEELNENAEASAMESPEQSHTIQTPAPIDDAGPLDDPSDKKTGESATATDTVMPEEEENPETSRTVH